MMAVVDYIGGVVAQASEKVKPIIGSDVFYQFGHIREIADTLQSYSNTAEFRRQKYPAVFLLQDFLERKGTRTDIETEVTLQLLIVAASTQKARSADRYRDVFKPILYPIYEALIKTLNSDPVLDTPYSGVPHEKVDRPLVSGALSEPTTGANKNLFNDFLDAVEVRKLNLKILKNCM
jgi:hypothetical protein